MRSKTKLVKCGKSWCGTMLPRPRRLRTKRRCRCTTARLMRRELTARRRTRARKAG